MYISYVTAMLQQKGHDNFRATTMLTWNCDILAAKYQPVLYLIFSLGVYVAYYTQKKLVRYHQMAPESVHKNRLILNFS